MLKAKISNLLRHLRLLYLTDKARFYFHWLRYRKLNQSFRKAHPEVKLPPDYLLYESFQLHYPLYYEDGWETAQELVELFRQHIELKDKKILDWGCGPGRIIRHMPALTGNGCEFYGTDYNQKSIAWCSQHLKGITFNTNTLAAQLPYPDNFFDLIYGYSIFTHLSETLHYEWYAELIRVLKPQGILFLTTQGNNYIAKLTNTERESFNQGQLVVRGKVKEGHRTYSAFHPEPFMRHLFRKEEIVEHLTAPPHANGWLPHDFWIVKKK